MAHKNEDSIQQLGAPMRQIELGVEKRNATTHSREAAEINAQKDDRRRKAPSILQLENTRRLRELEQENVRLKRLVAELSLQKLILKDLLAAKGL